MTYFSQFYLLNFSVLLATYAFLVILYKGIRAAASPLRRLPGPFLARFSRLWLFREAYNGRMHLTNVKVHEKYGTVLNSAFLMWRTNLLPGPIVRIAPNEYSIDDPESVQLIYGSRGRFTKVRAGPNCLKAQFARFLMI
jgi:hypothetical protein